MTERRSGACGILVSASLSLGLWSCAVGPDYKPPATPQTSGYTAETLPDQTARPATASLRSSLHPAP